MTVPLFDLPASASSARLAVAVREHLKGLADAGVMGPGHLLQAAIVEELADAMGAAGKGYAKAQLAKELAAAVERLPAPVDADAWDTWADLARQLAAPAGPVPAARYATRPTAGAAHELDAVAMVAALLGKPLMPWQRQVARVATERTPDGSRYRYRRVVVTVPRQAGKTTLLGALYVHRALTRAKTRVWMTAQTGKDATARWNDLRKLVAASPLAPFTHERLSAGSAMLEFLRSESHIGPFAPTPQSLHGYTFGDAAIDEAFAFSVDEGKALLGAIDPAMITVQDRQIWVTSTAGAAESTWLRSLVEHGRAHVDDPAAGVAYFEWAGDPTDDPSSPTAYAFHPAVGHTISVDDLLDAAANVPPSERDRAYRNLWVEQLVEPLLPAEDLTACPATTGAPPGDGSVKIAIGFDVDADGAASAIYTAWRQGDDTLTARLIVNDGMVWLADELLAAAEAAGPGAVIVTPPDGPSLEVVEQLRVKGHPVRVLDARAWSTACGALHRSIRRHDVHLTPADSDLAKAVAGAATKPLGDSWAISRTRSTTPVAAWGALAAATRILDEDGVVEFPLIEGDDE